MYAHPTDPHRSPGSWFTFSARPVVWKHVQSGKLQLGAVHLYEGAACTAAMKWNACCMCRACQTFVVPVTYVSVAIGGVLCSSFPMPSLLHACLTKLSIGELAILSESECECIRPFVAFKYRLKKNRPNLLFFSCVTRSRSCSMLHPTMCFHLKATNALG